MRLNILNDVVDYFVVTESPFTVSGNENHFTMQKTKIDLVSSMIR